MPVSTKRLITTLPAACVLLGGLGLSAGYALQDGEVTGTDHKDWFTPSAVAGQPNQYVTSDADDRIRALGGDDEVRTAGGDDAVDGGPGDDNIDVGDGDDVVGGGMGDDDIKGQAGDDILHGQEGEDIIRGHAGDDTIDGGEGDDELYGFAGDDTIDGGLGNDRLEGQAGDDTLNGGAENDTLLGGAGDDHLQGEDGNDILNGGEDNDVLYGGAGNDELRGFEDFDYLDGNEGADLLDGEGGEDLVLGRDGDDTLAGGAGDDYIVILGSDLANYTIFDEREVHPQTGEVTAKNEGTDMLCFVDDINPDQMTIHTLHTGRQVLEFDPGHATADDVTLDLTQVSMLDHIEAVRTGDGDDTIVGRDLTGVDSYGPRFTPAPGQGSRFIHCNELFFTGGGDDTIATNGGNDLVSAGAGDDTIHLGPGQHYVMTGEGQDLVTFDGTAFDGSAGAVHLVGRCRIADMSNEDRVVVSGGLTADDFRLEDHDWDGVPVTKVVYGDSTTKLQNEQFDLVGVRANQVTVRQQGQDVVITVRIGTPVLPPIDPSQPVQRDRVRENEGGGRDNLPTIPGGDRNPRGGR